MKGDAIPFSIAQAVGVAFHFRFIWWLRGDRRSEIDKKAGKMTTREASASGGIPLAAEKPSPEARDFPHEARDFPHEARDFPHEARDFPHESVE